VHIGLNAVDPGHYAGWSGSLKACEADANEMAKIAKKSGMESTVLLTTQGTRSEALASIRAAATQLKHGDFFLLSYSGHGGQVCDVTGGEENKQDTTWCLYDGQLIDDELYMELSRFAAGVRILVLSDCCHSGASTRARSETTPPGTRSKMMPPDIADRTYQQNKALYDKLQKAVAKAAGSGIHLNDIFAMVAVLPRVSRIVRRLKPAVIFIAGCQVNQTSVDGALNGAFTEQLVKVWNSGEFRGDYIKFHAQIKTGLPSSQTPNLIPLGAVKFLRQRPFSI
jgi:hypothetical protein